jgi:hypothetical protein
LIYEEHTLDESTGSSGVSRNLRENAPQVGQGRETAHCSDSRQSKALPMLVSKSEQEERAA